MKKEYFANREFNRYKRRKAVTLSVILFLLILGMSAIFATNKQYFFAGVFLCVLIVPIISLPLSFKNYPLHVNPIVIVDKDIIEINKKIFNVKDIYKISTIIELPSCKIDSKDRELLQSLKTCVPEDEYYGSFDVVYYDTKGKRQVEYAFIDHVVDALSLAVLNGVKNYELKFTIKKNTVVNECDLKKQLKSEEKPLGATSKKSRKLQLL